MNITQKEEFLYKFAGMAMQAILASGLQESPVSALSMATEQSMRGTATWALGYAKALVAELDGERDTIELQLNDATQQHPEHLERCLCWDTFENGYRCYVYDDISKYWCTQATTEHDPNGDNHVSDYADNRITHWSHLPKEGGEE